LVVEADGNTIVAVKRKGLSESDWKQYAIADNTASDFSTWDVDILNDLTQEVDLSEFFPDYKLNELLESFGKGEGFGDTEQQEEDEEEIAELLDKVDEIESRVKLGEIWQLGRHKICCSDSTVEGNVRALLGDRFGDVGMVWSDPPYGVNLQKKEGIIGSHTSKAGIKGTTYKPILNDDSTDIAKKSFLIITKLFDCNQIWWGANYYPEVLTFSSGWIFWDKTGEMQSNNYADGELAWSNFKTPLRSIKFMWRGMIYEGEREERLHPNQKPIGLVENVFSNYGNPDDLIFDPFLGSGTSIIAAEKMEGDRTVYGFELSPQYCTIILERFTKLTGIEPKLIGRLPD
jgi:site-specific DNA-methyltransferase (adenine-specific)